MSVDFYKLWKASTAIVPDDNVMLWQLLECLDEELAPLGGMEPGSRGQSFPFRIRDLPS
jgi:hypothetical protein